MNFLTCHIKPQSPSDFKHNNLFKGQFFQVTLLLNQLSHRHKKAMSEWCQLLNISPINFATPKRSGDQQRPYLSPMRCTENCQTLHPNFSMPQINSLTHLHWRLKSLIVKINSLSSWFKQNLLKMKIRFKKKKRCLENVSCTLYQFSSATQSCLTLCNPTDCNTPAFPVHQTITNSRSLLKLVSIESVMPPNYLILCHPLLLLTSIFPRIRVFSNESVLFIITISEDPLKKLSRKIPKST